MNCASCKFYKKKVVIMKKQIDIRDELIALYIVISEYDMGKISASALVKKSKGETIKILTESIEVADKEANGK